MLSLPAAQYLAWEQHLARWPVGDPLLQRLVAILCALVTNAHFQMSRPAEPHDFAPWLRTPADVERERKEALLRRAWLVEDAYLRNQTDVD